MLLSKNSIKKNICAVGGRSGGHLIPCIYYMLHKKNSDPSIDKIILFYSTTALTTSLVRRSTIINYSVTLPVLPIPYKQWYLLPWWTLTLCYSFFKSFFILIRWCPQEVMSSGGLESIPVCLAARILNISVIIFELNVIPGKAVIFLSRFIKNISICFKETASYFPHNNTILTSYPIRFSQEELKTPQHAALSHYNLSLDKKTIVILGGSQGSHSLNHIASHAIIELSHIYPHIQVIHQIGNDDLHLYKNLYKTHNINAVITPFEQHAHYLYSSADSIIARAGAGTLFEIEAFKKPACIVPLETATTDHQKDNALSFAKKNPQMFSVFIQQELEHVLTPLIEKLKAICATQHNKN